MTATSSNSRPFVPWAVARIRRASSDRSSASRARAARIRRANDGGSSCGRAAAQPSNAVATSSRGSRRLSGSRRRRRRGDSVADRGEAQQQRHIIRDQCARARREARPDSRSSSSSRAVARTGRPSSSAIASGSISSRFVRARTARVAPSGPAARHEIAASPLRRRRRRAPGRAAPPNAAPRRTSLRNRSWFVSISRTARRTTGAGQR